MKTFFSAFFLIVALPLATPAQEIKFSSSPYQALKKGFLSSPRAPGLHEIPWAIDASSTWKGCVHYFAEDSKYNLYITLIKWLEVPGDGPLLGDSELKINLYVSAKPVRLRSNENVMPSTRWHFDAEQKNLFVWEKYFGDPQKNYLAFRTDGKFIFFSKVVQDPRIEPSYGYCWK